MKIGGGSRTRTGDIRLAKPTLYQLSYAPGAAREAGSGSVSVYAGGFRFSFWEAWRASSPRHVSPGRLHAAQRWAAAARDELTIGTPDRSGSVSLERR